MAGFFQQFILSFLGAYAVKIRKWECPRESGQRSAAMGEGGEQPSSRTEPARLREDSCSSFQQLLLTSLLHYFAVRGQPASPRQSILCGLLREQQKPGWFSAGSARSVP